MPVIPSEARDLLLMRHQQILRFAQDDKHRGSQRFTEEGHSESSSVTTR